MIAAHAHDCAYHGDQSPWDCTCGATLREFDKSLRTPAERPAPKKKGGKRSRDKGCRFERDLVNIFQAAGISAERIPLSGSAGGSFAGDITLPVLGKDRRIECKKRAGGFALLYNYLAEHYGLIICQDRASPLMVMRLSDFVDLLNAAEGKKNVA
jgi:hypothetical protein